MSFHDFYIYYSHLLPKLFLGVVLFLIFWLIAIIAKAMIVRLANRMIKRKYLYRLVGSAAKSVIILAGVVTALGTIGVNVAALITSLGLMGFAVGIALKDPLSNLISGFLILIYRPFTVGDTISISSTTGEVVDINLRYTVVKTDSERAMVPNSNVLTNVLTVKMRAAKK